MNSIAESMTWELLSRSKWSLVASALGAAIIPVIAMILLKNADALDHAGKELEVLHYVWIHCECLVLIAATVSSRSRIKRLYSLPISTPSLVFWRLIPASVASALAFTAIAVAINSMFAVDWPILGPALFVGVATATVQTTIWLGGHSPLLQVIVMTLAAAPLSFWLKSHYGPTIGQPVVYWRTVTPLDGMTILAWSVLSYYVAVAAVARDRRGDAPNFARLRAWFDAWEARRQISMSVPATPLRAQFWYEWTQKGFILPVIVAFFTLIFLPFWVWSGARPETLREGLEGIGYGLGVACLIIGLVFGACGRSDSDPRLGGFLASRPLSDASFALSILRTTGRSVFAAWALWAIMRAVLLACLAPELFRTPTQEIWIHIGSLLGWWTAAAIPACASLTGRAEFCLGLLLGICALFVCEGLFVRLFVPENYRPTAERVFAYADALLCLSLAIGLYVKALRRGLLGPLPVFIAAVIWVSLIAVGGSALIATFTEIEKWSGLFFILLACGTALSLTPIAAAPLAVSWNRHR